MVAPTIPELGPTTVNRKWIIEVDTSDTGTAAWTPLGGTTSVTPNFDNANLVEDTDFAGAGAASQQKTSFGWSIASTVRRGGSDGDLTAYDPGQEFIRSKSIGVVGPANSVSVRCYEYDANDPDGTYSPRIEAYSGKAAVSWQDQGGDAKALSMVSVTFTGQGPLAQVDHPYPVS